MDAGIIPGILGSIKVATDLAKLINESGVSLEKAEIKLKMADLISALATARMDIAEIQQALLEKDREIARLQGKLTTREKATWEEPYYWVIDGDKKDGPYCQQCQDKDHELIRLISLNKGVWECKTCKNMYYDRAFDIQSYIGTSDDCDPLRYGR